MVTLTFTIKTSEELDNGALEAMDERIKEILRSLSLDSYSVMCSRNFEENETD